MLVPTILLLAARYTAIFDKAPPASEEAPPPREDRSGDEAQVPGPAAGG